MSALNIEGSIWINKKKRPFMGKGRVEILKLIHQTGSLTKAAKSMGISYKAAWDMLKDMNEVSGTALVESVTGGKNGGGSILTQNGLLYIKLYEKVYEEQKNFFVSLEKHIDDYDKFIHFLDRNFIRVSARNQFIGKITSIDSGILTSEIGVDIGKGVLISASITSKSVNELGLKKSSRVLVVIKSSWVKIVGDNFFGQNVFDTVVKSSQIQEGSIEITASLKNGLIVVTSSKIPSNIPNIGDSIKIFIDKSDIILGV